MAIDVENQVEQEIKNQDVSQSRLINNWGE